MPRLDRGKFDLDECWKWYCAQIKVEYEKRVADLGITEQDARNKRAQADLRELQLAKLRGEIVSSRDVVAEWDRIQAIVKTKLLAVPSKLAVRGLACSSPAELQSLTESEIKEALAELSNMAIAGPSGIGRDRVWESAEVDTASQIVRKSMGGRKAVHPRRGKSKRAREVADVQG